MSSPSDSDGLTSAGGESKEQLMRLIENVKDYAIFMLDPRGHVTTWNQGAERLKGYTAEEIIGKHFSRFYPADAIAQGKPDFELRQAMAAGYVEDEGWRIRKDGTRFWANVVITALFDKERKLLGFGKITRDLTERKKMEALREADRRKNEFLALLGHELRTPLAALHSALNVMALPEASEQDIQEVRKIAERQVQQMTRLMDDLLDTARISQGKMELRKKVRANLQRGRMASLPRKWMPSARCASAAWSSGNVRATWISNGPESIRRLSLSVASWPGITS